MCDGMCRAWETFSANPREDAGGRQRQRRMHRVVEGVDGVVGRAGMVGVPVEQLQGDRTREDVATLRFGGRACRHQE